MTKEERYQNVLNYWKTRDSFKDEDDIGSIPIVSIDDYINIIIPNIIRCGGIPKVDLVVGQTYIGSCRNASEAVWDGTQFVYDRIKFGRSYKEAINHFEDDDGYDLFIPIHLKE